MNEQEEKRQKITDQLKRDYKAVFATGPGKRVLEDLSLRCYAKTTTFRDFDPYSMVFNEGRRSVFLHIETMVKRADEPPKPRKAKK